jgi:hypothetical protein
LQRSGRGLAIEVAVFDQVLRHVGSRKLRDEESG